MKTATFALPLVLACAAAALAAPDGPLRGKSPEYRSAIAAILAIQKSKPPSLSTGTLSKGGLQNAAEVPAKGVGYRLASGNRKTNFGTDEMVYGLVELAAYVQEVHPKSPPMSFGDISMKDGGKLAPHLNHQDGRDADVAFFYCDPQGTPLDKGWLKCDEAGKTANAQVLFDVPRNFELLTMALESPFFGGFEWIFIHEPLKSLLIAYGHDLAKKVPQQAERIEGIVAQLQKVLEEPKSSPHADHFHFRVKRAPAH